MLVVRFVVHHSTTLDRFLGNFEGEMGFLLPKRGAFNGEFEGIERVSRISAADFGQMLQGIVINDDFSQTEAMFRVSQCA